MERLGALPEEKRRSVLISSAQPKEGKSFCAVNLALSLAGEREHDVLLVDGDFSKPDVPAILGLPAGPGLVEALADAAGVAAGEVVGSDLVLADTQPAGTAGADGTWVAAPRLDDQACCHSGLTALIGAPAGARTQVLVCNDHEEVGSGSMSGARGSFLEDVVRRLAAVPDPADPQALPRTLARSRLVSADMAHAVHPTRFDRHEPAHQPQLGGGPVLKLNANQAYATDAASGGWFTERCAEAGVPVQHFVTRADLPCGSTIGPLTATRLGLPTVDVGAPMLAMHSCRELASALDVPYVVDALTACYTG
jgi:aspartyl aminopeptidase